MAYAINDTCISCGACEGGCPVGAISMGDEHMMIDAGTCIDCGSCADTCPVGAIAPAGSPSKGSRDLFYPVEAAVSLACEPFSFTAGYTAAL